ncbi:MAG: hypothetical protein ACR2L2_01825 [Acidobacteriota bacterium]
MDIELLVPTRRRQESIFYLVKKLLVADASLWRRLRAAGATLPDCPASDVGNSPCVAVFTQHGKTPGGGSDTYC